MSHALQRNEASAACVSPLRGLTLWLLEAKPMNCPHCNTPHSAGARFCPTCGEAYRVSTTGPEAWMPLTAEPLSAYPGTRPFAANTLGSRQPDPISGRVAQNLQPLGIVWCIWGFYRLIFGLTASIAIHTFAGHNGWWHGDDFMPGFLHTLLPFITITTALMAGLSLTVGYGLLSRRPWARPLGIIMSILALLKLPLGTALGTYTLWVLAPRVSAVEYQVISQQTEATRLPSSPTAAS